MLTPIEIIKRLKPCTWVYNSIKPLGDQVHFGFIAQDLLETFGEEYGFVDSSQEYLRVNYSEFIGPIVKVLQAQQEIIEQHESRIKELEKLLKDKNE